MLRIKAVFCAIVLVCASLAPTQVHASEAVFTDVPADSWAVGAIEAAVSSELMSGTGNGLFGYGRSITRAEFVTVLCNMFGWEPIAPDSPKFSDVSPGQWCFGYVEAAAAQGVTLVKNTASGAKEFAPDEPILRKEMAVLLVKALGYDGLADQVAKFESVPFSDVDSDQAYIIVARDIGMISGVGDGRFAPNDTAKREEAASMLTKVHGRLNAQVDWRHSFYGFSSYAQRDDLNIMDSVSYCWSAMNWDSEDGAKLNITAVGGNQWRVPDGYELITEYSPARENGIKANLGVYMDTSMGLYQLLSDETARTEAVGAIVAEASRVYAAIHRSPYDGVTIDFEGLKGGDAKADFTTFLEILADDLHELGKSLYVTVPPVTSDGAYYDGYDYRAIGKIADKVILMAHDYEPVTMEGLVGTKWAGNAALTPVAQVYKALKAITDTTTGVEDKSKIALAISFANIGWMVDENNQVVSPDPVKPSLETVQARMEQPDTKFGWSDIYWNPYMIYTIEDGSHVFLWYENNRSVTDKLTLARLFGVTGVSVWRIGIIPDWLADIE